ncbi:MAG TPA: Asp-tRNA(Asn)/Glu-tRNA(Gln) amidotransferase subunit GatB [Acidimicrobiales bacterium]|nr:Asp-tRNA(Asn)/Glu-tRNA(Gln) amidotransferase subunit GatB [Acidimicrobiales bacterium]
MTTQAATSRATTGWETVVGLEVHCELATATKLFCGCRNAFGDEPNTNVCPVCLGLPGSLPVLNRQAVELAMRIGAALHCEVRPSIFHRKNYFYPDMPKDYQISQYDEPINVGGWLELPDGTRVGITRAHLEEDTGKTTHVHGVQAGSRGESGRIHGAEHALVDYNRAGVPLVEIVSEPDIRSVEAAQAYVNELRAILVAIGASDARMEEGSLRVDANVSVRPVGANEFGTRAEIKNLNSVRSLRRALEYETARQVELLESGQRVVQETRHWNEDAGRTSSMRSKEEAFDYRYFPEPDLVPLAPEDEWKAEVAATLPMLPAARRAELASKAGVAPPDVALVVDRGLDRLVEAAIDGGADPRLALARAANEVAADLQAGLSLDPGAFAGLLRMEADGRLTATQAKQVLSELLAHGGDPAEIAEARGFEALGGDTLAAAVDAAVAAHPAEWERLAAGEQKLLGFFVGKVMAATAGRADGKAVTRLLRERIG